MAKIAFWSNIHGQPGTTSNTLAVSIMDTLVSENKNALMQSHFNMNNLEIPLLKKYTDMYGVGIDELGRSICSAPLDEKTIVNASMSFLNKKLNLILGTQVQNKVIYERDMNTIFTKIVEEVHKYHDNVFLDVSSGNSELSSSIIQKSDLIVVNLPQNKQVINSYFAEYKIEPQKVIYMIGNYNCNSRYNLKNLRRMYQEFNRNNLVGIPYNVEYQDALSDGEVIDFLMKNLNCGKQDKNYNFIQSVKEAVNMICSRCAKDEMRLRA